MTPTTKESPPPGRTGDGPPKRDVERGRRCEGNAGGATGTSGPRRVSVAQHERFRCSLAGGPAFDPDDDLLEVIDRPPARRKGIEVDRLLSILDELEAEEADA